ncbi:hypothetical protein Acr_00g0014890 [Actinidia rufa]|uniref:Uncharacterized protein n=1 Tax=Actinidia rufa TaxID=165716 RepID=A0A7J0DAF4_9ERIC|nr:hypothetical protein Acr_00g0014890 [Actinidia rufa]
MSYGDNTVNVGDLVEMEYQGHLILRIDGEVQLVASLISQCDIGDVSTSRGHGQRFQEFELNGSISLGHRGQIPNLNSNSEYWLFVPDFYHNSLASFVGTTVLNTLCTCVAAYCLDRRHDKSTTQKNKDLDAQTDAINTSVKAAVTMDALIRVRQKNASHFFTVHQEDGESLKDYVKRFNQTVLKVEDFCLGLLFDSLSKSIPETFLVLKSKADKYIATEKLAEGTCLRVQVMFIRVVTPIAQVLMENKNEDIVKWLGKIKINSLRRNKNKYCEFHKAHGHNTKDYFQLKKQIVDLIKRGYLRKFVADRPRNNSLERGYADNRTTTSDIQTIHGDFDREDVQPHPQKGMLERLMGEQRRRFTISPRL